MITINKKTILTILLIILVSVTIFLFVKYGIALRQLEKQEIAEQIAKLGYYRADFHINAEREILQHKYQLALGIPMFTTLMIIIPAIAINIYTMIERNKS